MPAFMLLFSSMEVKVEHFRRYCEAPLVALLKSAGIEIRAVRYCDPPGFFAALLYRFVGNSGGDLDPRTVKLFDRVVFPVGRWLELTGRFFGRKVPVVATRPG